MHVLNVVAKKIQAHRHAGRGWIHVKDATPHGEFTRIFHGFHSLIPARRQPRRQFRWRHVRAHAQRAVQHFPFFGIWNALHQRRDRSHDKIHFAALKRVRNFNPLQKNIGGQHAFPNGRFKRGKSHGVATKIVPLGDHLVGLIQMRHSQHRYAFYFFAKRGGDHGSA